MLPGVCLSIAREPRWQGEGADARRAARSIVGTMDKPCNAADAPAHRSADTAKYNGCARAKCLANPSGPGRFPLMRRCRLLIGCIPNLVGSATPFGEICRGRGHVEYSDRLLGLGLGLKARRCAQVQFLPPYLFGFAACTLAE